MDYKNLASTQMGQYELLELIGEGGMSAVYRAYQSPLAREVAIKVISQEVIRDPADEARFVLEARTAAQLEYIGIIPVYDYGNFQNLNFVVMRLMPGGTLAERLNYCKEHPEQPLPTITEVSNLLRVVSQALGYAHSRGIIHRDIKANNIMFGNEGDPNIVDFGIARIINSDVSLTKQNIIVGTPTYMPPEQWRNQTLTPAVDQYALGVLVYQMLTNRLPFDGKTPHALMYQHLHDTPKPPHEIRSGIPKSVTPVLARAMAKDPRDRFATIEQFSEVFSLAVKGDKESPTNFFTFQLPASTHRLKTLSVPRIEMNDTDLPLLKEEYFETGPQDSQGISQPPLLEKEWLQTLSVLEVVPNNNKARKRTRSRFRGVILGGLLAFASLLIAGLIAFLLLRNTAFGQRLESVLLGTVPATSIVAEPTDIPVVELDDPTATDILILPPTATRTSTTETVATAEATEETEEPTATRRPSSTPRPTATKESSPTPENTPTPEATDVPLPEFEVASILHRQKEIPVRDIAVSSQGVIVSAHNDGLIRKWDSADGFSLILSGHTGVVYRVDFNLDGDILASAGEDGTVQVWDIDAMEVSLVFTEHDGEVRDLAFVPENTLIVSVGEDGQVLLWDYETGEIQTEFGNASVALNSVAVTLGGEMIVAGDEQGAIKVWDIASGVQIGSIRQAHSGIVQDLEFSPDGELLASSSPDNDVKVWDYGELSLLHTFSNHQRNVWGIAFHPSGMFLASGGSDNNIRLWDIEAGEQIATLSEHEGWVFAVRFSDDGSILVSAGSDGSVRLWDASSAASS